MKVKSEQQKKEPEKPKTKSQEAIYLLFPVMWLS